MWLTVDELLKLGAKPWSYKNTKTPFVVMIGTDALDKVTGTLWVLCDEGTAKPILFIGNENPDNARLIIQAYERHKEVDPHLSISVAPLKDFVEVLSLTEKARK